MICFKRYVFVASEIKNLVSKKIEIQCYVLCMKYFPKSHLQGIFSQKGGMSPLKTKRKLTGGEGVHHGASICPGKRLSKLVT